MNRVVGSWAFLGLTKWSELSGFRATTHRHKLLVQTPKSMISEKYEYMIPSLEAQMSDVVRLSLLLDPPPPTHTKSSGFVVGPVATATPGQGPLAATAYK